VLQERKAETQQFPYRYSYYQEEAAQIWRDYWGRGPDLFFMTTEEMHALLSDLQALGAAQIGVTRVAQEDEEDEKPEHHVHATKQWETIITREDMLALGWPELHIRWLLSQIGVLDDQAEEGEEGGDANGAEAAVAGDEIKMASPDGRIGDEFDEFVEAGAEGAAVSSDVNGAATTPPPKAASGGGTTLDEEDIRAAIAASVNQAKTEIMDQHQKDVNRLRKDLLAAIAQLQDPSSSSALTAAAIIPSDESDDGGGTMLAPASAPAPPAPEEAANTGRRQRRLP
jgi:hypothetical protein